MSKPFYAEYANHAMRFYARHSDGIPAQIKQSDAVMWQACDKVLRNCTEAERSVLMAIYRSKCPINDAVECICAELSLPANKVWQTLSNYSRAFAKERGLI